MATASVTDSHPPWHAAYPAPQNTPATILREDVLDLIKQSTKTSSRDYILIDLRRNDHEGGTIRDSINLPAQSLYPTIPTFYTLFKSAGLRKIIWYCCMFPSGRFVKTCAKKRLLKHVHEIDQVCRILASSKGRGNRAAGWFADYIAHQGDDQMKSLVLAQGVKGWATAGDEYIQWMTDYDAKAWLQS